MRNLRIGDLVSFQNHPYELALSNVKIAALANMTPPILVVSEILNSQKEYDTETGNEKPKQLKCIFYSHKSHRFENLWFDVKTVKAIKKQKNENLIYEKNDEINTSAKNEIKYSKSCTIEEIKNQFQFSQVILKSCEYELGKIKTTFNKIDNKSSQKINSHLDFLSPVLTVIDVKYNEEKIGYNPKSGNLKKLSSVFLLKCKWYNSLSGNFSEDFIPIETVLKIEKENHLNLISELILKKYFFKNVFKKSIILEGGVELNFSYIQPIELIFNHYKYKLRYFDFFKTKFAEIDLSDIDLSEVDLSKIDLSEIDLSEIKDISGIIELNDLIIDRLPEYKADIKDFNSVSKYEFEKDNFYKITYKDSQDRITKRVIYIKEIIEEKVLIVDCLLREGQERHFRLKEGSILKIEVLNPEYFS